MLTMKGPLEKTVQRILLISTYSSLCVSGLIIYGISGIDGIDLITLITASLILTITCIAIVRIVVRKNIVYPINRIIDAMNSFVGGISTIRVDKQVSTVHELKELAESFNSLAEKSSKDISELKKLEQVRSQFLGNVSHELRTPIFSIQGYLETLLDGALDDPAVRRKFVERSHANAIRLNVLLSDLIDISKIESGEMRMSYRYFNAIEMIHDVLHSLEYQAQQYQVHLETKLPEEEVLVYGDKERLTQALTNLVENAMKYNKVDGKVIVELTMNSTQVTISVKDSGIGIASEHKDRIFERFYRVDKDRSRAVGGTGLGLAIVKHILEAHQTTPIVESIPGEGTTISFTLKI
ncbi:MAG: sensor histidine kinase [Candidatus Kapaibacteriota bacterium]